MKKLVSKLFLKPKSVKKSKYGIYIVVRFICILSLLTTLILLPIAYFVSNTPLVFLNILGFLAVVYVTYLNQQGKDFLAIGLFSTCMYLYSVNAVILIGWQAGFQYYLIPLITLLFLHPDAKGKYLSLFALFPAITFLYLSTLPSNIPNGNKHLYTFLHTYNAINVFLALAFVNYYFRTNVFRLLKDLDSSSKTDMLTGLMNRRYMSAELNKYSSMTERYENPASILLIDIDHFKPINDGLGHLAGDALLKQFAILLKSRIRETDLLARWGGDEFLLLTPFTNLTAAKELAEDLRSSVETHNFLYENRSLSINITIGISVLDAQRSVQESLRKVDQLLYQGKNNGRNQVVKES